MLPAYSRGSPKHSTKVKMHGFLSIHRYGGTNLFVACLCSVAIKCKHSAPRHCSVHMHGGSCNTGSWWHAHTCRSGHAHPPHTHAPYMQSGSTVAFPSGKARQSPLPTMIMGLCSGFHSNMRHSTYITATRAGRGRGDGAGRQGGRVES